MTDLTEESYGPITHFASAERVAAFVLATGDDPEGWTDHAPPGYAAAGLLTVAGQLLSAAMDDFPAIIHTRQRFEWEGPLAVGSEVEVTGEVASIKERFGMTVVEFVASVPGWMTSTSSFLMSDSFAGDVDEVTEPSPDTRAATEIPVSSPPPAAGEALLPLAKSASRLDILRYAAASGDWNPIHWDHESATAAGVGGVVAHGLLAASWLAQAGARYSSRPDPLASIDLRFRQPLRPGDAAIVGGTVSGVAPLALDLALTVGGNALVTANEEVNG